MKRLHRRLLFFVSTLIFLALAPLVILYAMGYRTLATTVDPIPVGVVLLETFPRRATATVNDRDVGRTPRTVPNIAAGDVHITLRKEGYKSWEKTVVVKPGLATELRGVRLWLAERTPHVLVSGAERVSLSPNRQLVAVYFGNKTLQIFDQDGEPVSARANLRRSPQALLWAPDNATILLQNHDLSHDIFTLAAPPRRALALTGAVALAWDPRIPGRLIVQSQSGTLRAYHTITQASSTIATRVTHFGLSSRHIYVVTSTGKINVYNLQGTFARTLPLVLAEPIERLLVTPEGRIAVVMKGKLWVGRETGLVEVSTALDSVHWSPDGRTLLLQPDATSLYVYNEADERSAIPLQELQLVARLSRPIKSPQWFAGGAHVLYQVEDEIKIIEIDTRDHAIEEVVDTTNLGEAHPMVGEDGEVLFYLKREAGQTNVVALRLVSNL